jgi:hypothetical protein
MTPSKTQPALVGGLFIGVLSALPLVNLGNCCCCLWVVAGGAIAAWLLQQRDPAPISVADAMGAGLLAGLVGAVVGSVVSIPINLLTGPMVQGWLEQFVQSARDLPPEFREAFEQARQGQDGSLGIAVATGIVWFLVSLVVYGVFAAAGGALGAVFFRKAPSRPVAPPPPFAPPPSPF